MDSTVTVSRVSRRRRRPRRLLRRLGIAAVALALAVAVPFAALLRISTYLYAERAWPTWTALGLAAACALVVLTLYAAAVSRWLTGRARLVAMAKWVALPLVLAYTGYAMLYVSRINTKTPDVRSYYTTLQPLLRLALSSWILIDGDLVITDAARVPEDYAAMGLPLFERSRHFRQDDGWVHAADLRTIGRSRVRNWLTEQYFRMLGFATLRHVGTADHLHVALRRAP